jgi:hypothetical protein
MMSTAFNKFLQASFHESTGTIIQATPQADGKPIPSTKVGNGGFNVGFLIFEVLFMFVSATIYY